MYDAKSFAAKTRSPDERNWTERKRKWRQSFEGKQQDERQLRLQRLDNRQASSEARRSWERIRFSSEVRRSTLMKRRQWEENILFNCDKDGSCCSASTRRSAIKRDEKQEERWLRQDAATRHDLMLANCRECNQLLLISVKSVWWVCLARCATHTPTKLNAANYRNFKTHKAPKLLRIATGNREGGYVKCFGEQVRDVTTLVTSPFHSCRPERQSSIS